MSTTKKICITALGTALYVCVSMLLKIPIVNHMSLDLGYIVFAVYCYMYGSIIGGTVGCAGAFFVSLIATGWLGIEWPLGNLVAGLICGKVYTVTKGKKHADTICLVTTVAALFIGIALIKTTVACAIYSIPFGIKFVKNCIIFVIDTAVMCAGYLFAKVITPRIMEGESK